MDLKKYSPFDDFHLQSHLQFALQFILSTNLPCLLKAPWNARLKSDAFSVNKVSI